MKGFLKGTFAYLVVISLALLISRNYFDYLSTIDLVDYIAYSGVLLVVLAGITFDGNNPANQDFLSLMVHRELVSRTNDSQDENNKVSFSVNVGLIGIFFLIVSAVMAWHISK
ncbi:hypothetical protein BCV39_22070 [Vibrio sp. 10N.286.55.E10]|uniref:hypothetical protein n=1 Tax=unclassified Vibrio TaxID=2614977 RepID=UPI000C818B59|nr:MULTISPECIES: hypothetical protein [unclassified Vibrio]PME33120.1 hypothetical protein BCV39_22070 [Vibrio sp. 10N.286.55.E10]PME42687.1 hypothetical protein BCV40_20960 [Vibrio sp. 10N.286.55.E12]PME62384.1 hypothetical protein BCV32_22050 [Vibrio sp. 10N.286.55.C11]PTO87187.1 hypothetical protein CWO08_23595 [Vibrio sp. 10N.286.48.B8]